VSGLRAKLELILDTHIDESMDSVCHDLEAVLKMKEAELEKMGHSLAMSEDRRAYLMRCAKDVRQELGRLRDGGGRKASGTVNLVAALRKEHTDFCTRIRATEIRLAERESAAATGGHFGGQAGAQAGAVTLQELESHIATHRGRELPDTPPDLSRLWRLPPPPSPAGSPQDPRACGRRVQGDDRGV